MAVALLSTHAQLAFAKLGGMTKSLNKLAQQISKGTTNQRRKTVFQELAARLIRSKMQIEDKSYKELAADLGGGENHISLTTKINRGTFSAAFLIQTYLALGYKSIDLTDVAKVLEDFELREAQRAGAAGGGSSGA